MGHHLDDELARHTSRQASLEKQKAECLRDIETYEGAVANYNDSISRRREVIADCDRELVTVYESLAKTLRDKAESEAG